MLTPQFLDLRGPACGQLAGGNLAGGLGDGAHRVHAVAGDEDADDDGEQGGCEQRQPEVDEVLRVLDALQSDELCACNWKKGDPTLNAGELLAEAV